MSSGRRIVYTVATGEQKYINMAKALAISIAIHGSSSERVILTDSKDPELSELFDEVIDPHPDYPHWFAKLCCLETTDADQILFLDGDSLAVGNIDAAFDFFSGRDLAVQGQWLSPNYWWGDLTKVLPKLGVEKIPVFNGGMIYYERSENTKKLIATALEFREKYVELGLETGGGQPSDEICISLAMATTGIGSTISDGLAVSRTPIKSITPVHLDVLKGECIMTLKSPKMEVVKPLVYHSAHSKWDLKYLRQVNRLLKEHRKPLKMTYFGPQSLGSKLIRKMRRVLAIVYCKVNDL